MPFNFLVTHPPYGSPVGGIEKCRAVTRGVKDHSMQFQPWVWTWKRNPWGRTNFYSCLPRDRNWPIRVLPAGWERKILRYFPDIIPNLWGHAYLCSVKYSCALKICSRQKCNLFHEDSLSMLCVTFMLTLKLSKTWNLAGNLSRTCCETCLLLAVEVDRWTTVLIHKNTQAISTNTLHADIRQTCGSFP